MRALTTRVGASIAVALLVAISAGCSSDSKSSTATTVVAGSGEDTTAAGEGGAVATTGGGSGDGGVASPIQNGTYSNARIHAEFSGDTAGAIEIDGVAGAVDGFLNMAFNDEPSHTNIAFAIGSDGAAVTFTYDGYSFVGEFGKECTIAFTTADETTLEGTFECTAMPAVDAAASSGKSVAAKGNFRATA